MTRNTSSDGLLTADARRHYDAQGYWLARGLFPADQLESFSARFTAIVEGDIPPVPGMLVMRDVMIAKGAVKPGSRNEAIAKIQDYENDEILFERYAKSETILDWIECFTGPDIKSIHTMLINKPPNVDGRHPLHQDLLYFPFRPADRIVAAWTAIQSCTRENGCLVVVPGSHKNGLRRHENPDWEYLNPGYFGVAGEGETSARVHLEMEPGDTVFFHPLLVHGSGRNRSSGFRRAISAHYAAADCEFLPGAESVADIRPYTLVRGTAHEGKL